MQENLANICEQYEREWRGDVRPCLSQYLRLVDESVQQELAQALLEVDLRFRIERGESPSRDEYRPAFIDADFDWSMLFEQAMTKAASTQGRANSDTSISQQEVTQAYQVSRRSEPAIPERIGRYRIEHLLGQGHFGVVYSAWDELLQRSVAVKLPRLQPTKNEDQFGRLSGEARLVAGLSHPAIVPIFDCDRLPDGRWLLVYELMTGGTLADELNRGRPTVERTVDIVTSVAEGLQVAHQAGIYHRDLKSRNILLMADGRPKIADFGLAIHEDVLSEQRDAITGSPAYMSPEQVRGESHLLDGRTDIWSLGIIFYEMLTGQRPFRGDSIQGLFELILKKAPRPPRQLDPKIDKELERICLKCLQKSPSDRYLTALDLIADLSRWQQQLVEVPSPVSIVPWSTTITEATRSRPLVLIGVFTLASLAALITLGGAVSGFLTKRMTIDQSAVLEKTPEKRTHADLPVRVTKPGEWKSLLSESITVLAKPDNMQGTRWELDQAKNSLTVSTDHPLLLKFDETAAPNFDLRLGFHQSNWTGGIGIFWSGAEIRGPNGSLPWVFQTIIAPPLMPGDKDRVLRLSWRRINLLKNSLYGQSDIWRDVRQQIPEQNSHDLLVRIRQRRVSEVIWNGELLPQLLQLPSTLTDDVTSNAGAVGLILSKTQLVVHDFSLRILE